MAFVMIATGATSRSRVRTVPVRPLLAVAAFAALALLGSGGAVGYWVADLLIERAVPAAAATAAGVGHAANAASPLPFTLEQVGALSGRVFRLESEAAQLSKRIGILRKETPPPAARGQDERATVPGASSSGDAPRPGASGGPWLPPRADAGPLDAIDEQLGRIERQIASVASAAALHSVELMRLPTRLPIGDAELTSTFGNRVDPFAHSHAFHAGLDFAARAGTPIAAAAGGVVSYAGFKRDYGWVVEIDHGNGLATRYAHASALLVASGQLVVPGDRIAMVGSTGRSTGPHLHFEVLRRGEAVDPKRWLAGL